MLQQNKNVNRGPIMPKFKVVTDSSVHLTQEEINAYGITVVPLSTILNGKLYVDGDDEEKAEFLQKMKESTELPKSSQPPLGLFVDAYNELSKDGSHILSIHVTHTLSGTVDCARQAAQITDGQVTVIDSEFCARAMAFQVLEAAKCANEGLSIEEAMSRIDVIRAHTILYISIVDLTNMIRGGRIGKTMGAISQVLNIKANLQMVDGALQADAKGRGTKSIVKRFEEIMREMKEKGIELLEVGITHDGLATYSEKIIDIIKQAYPTAKYNIAYASGSVMTHAGPDAISFQFLRK